LEGWFRRGSGEVLYVLFVYVCGGGGGVFDGALALEVTAVQEGREQTEEQQR
jgi:hypothetical protein